MRRKLLFIFAGLCVLSVLVSGYVIYSIENATRNLGNVIQLHKVAVLREDMRDQIKIVQRDLHLKQTRHARDLATMVFHVNKMTETIDVCSDCHHKREVIERLAILREKTQAYKRALSRVYTIRANEERLMKEEDMAFLVGEDLIDDVDEMLAFTNANLERKTQQVLSEVNISKNLLITFTIFAPLTVIALAIWFYFKFTRPISILVDATRHLREGDLDFQVEELKDEFGDVGRSFNEMSRSLREIMANMMRAEQMVLMGEMASRLAHEIKNPITGIKLATQVIRDESGLGEEFKDLCRKTINQIKSIERLMKGLLNFAKPPAPHLEMENLNEIINTSFSTIEVLVKETSKKPGTEPSINLVKKLDEDLPPILTDAGQVQQILLNLMLNALDAMPHGGILTIRSSKAPVEGFLSVEVSDTGHGFSAQEAERIFQPFYSTKIKGTGLGLAIVTRLVEMLGGKLEFKSEVDVGTTFTVSFPIVHAEGGEKK